MHVSDLAGAPVKALNALQAGAASSAYNLGLGRGFGEARQVTGRSVPVIGGNRRLGDPAKLVSDATKAGEEPVFAKSCVRPGPGISALTALAAGNTKPGPLCAKAPASSRFRRPRRRLPLGIIGHDWVRYRFAT